jgi:hypothetical protein
VNRDQLRHGWLIVRCVSQPAPAGFDKHFYRLNVRVLDEGGDVLFDSEVDEKGLDFWVSYFFGVAFVVEEKAAFDPVIVSLFGAVGVLLGARDAASLIEKFFR